MPAASVLTTPARAASLLDLLLPRLTAAHDLLLVVAGSLLVALCAQVSLPLPFSPVPVTGQTFAVLLLGAAFGARRSAAALALYLLEGALGLPVFAPGGAPGLARLVGPTGGYLLAFPAAAFLAGWILERSERRGWWRWLLAVLAAEAVIFSAGVSWLRAVTQSDWLQAAQLGLLPFLPGEILKMALLAAALPASWWAARRGGRRRAHS
ncbi:MAG: biotin transporter BioY [Candidatus Acidiferrales bacterium]